MTKRIVFHLSGAWNSGIKVSLEDKVYVAPWIDASRTSNCAQKIELEAGDFEAEICSQFAGLYAKSSIYDSTGMIFCGLNDFYSYSVRQVYSLLIPISKLAEKHSDYEITVVTAKADCEILPMFGFRTSESQRGSKDLVGALVARQMHGLPAFRDSHFEYVKGDALCSDRVRVGLLRAANIAFSILFFFKVFRLGINAHPASEARTVVLYRNEHQARFAKRIAGADDDVSLCFLPQITQGSFSVLKKEVVDISFNKKKLGLSIFEILKAFLSSKKILRRIKGDIAFFEKECQSDISVGGLTYPINVAWIAKEFSLLSSLIFYKAILSQLIEKYSIKRIINFELVGNMAGIEALSAREKSASIYTIQTALVSSRPHPVFPVADIFFSDSEETRVLIENIGLISAGVVDYAGPIYEMKNIEGKTGPNNIVFFTQPYEISVTLSILDLLCRWATHKGATILIKLHPRDNRVEYSALLEKYNNCLSISQGRELNELFSWADLSVTRTSSVAKEAITNGCPVILCLWSAFDRSIKSDYINVDLLSDYSSLDSSDLSPLLDSLDRVVKSNSLLQEKISSGKYFKDLIEALNNDN